MKLNGKTQLIGLLGWPVSHSFSPAMHNAALAASELNWAYVALPVRPDLVETAVRGLSALGFRGVNVTIPHKQAVMPYLDFINEGAKAIGAVNTIKIEENETPRLSGYNTDWSGFLADLKSLRVDIIGRDCLILGAGGSARAVAYGLAKAKTNTVIILSRRQEQSDELVHALSPFVPHNKLRAGNLQALHKIISTLTKPLIVNSTPLGMTPHPNHSIWPDDLPFPSDSFVYDLVYNPPRTKVMAQAQASGCQAANGLGMLIHQGAQAFELWTGIAPNLGIMRKAISEEVEEPE